MEIKTAYDAYWFLNSHPNCVEIDPDHPFVDTSTYAYPGIGVVGTDKMIMAREGKPRDAEYERAYKELAVADHWRGQFINNLDIFYAMVNPVTKRIEKDTSKNTKIEVWLETGPAYFDEHTNQYRSNMHDTRLDCGGDTFEEALIKLANSVKEKYGDYERE